MRTQALLKKTKLLFVIGCVSFLETGCLHPTVGPKSVPRDRAAYSANLADSWKEQMLLNIVKLRYLDAPQFIDIGNIVVSYTLTEGATAGGTIPVGGDGSATLGIAGTFSNSPTITYTPLSGSAFIQALLKPFPPEAIFGAIQNGVPADSIMLSTVVSVNGLKNQQATFTGITPPDPAFDRVRALVRKIQLSGAVRTYVKHEATAPVTVVAVHTANIAPEIVADIQELRRLLKLNPNAEEFTLVQAPVSSSDTEIAMLTRSIVNIMQNMAADVEVPTEDLSRHYAFPGYETEVGVPETARMIQIHSGKQRSAEAFVAVKYEGNWFWIDKGDLHSKQVFLQLMNLFTMADIAPRAAPPTLTIPTR